ncbi:MAG: N-6 DNA methylase, partial [Euryarchaeota archaeon]|nr:N-6 DNA methylase [Euryarchaeota archaeon]
GMCTRIIFRKRKESAWASSILPIEVVKYILDQVGFTRDEKIEGKKLLDPACGSGTFLVEATNRLIERYLKKYGRKSG